jgi:hypothetical protein
MRTRKELEQFCRRWAPAVLSFATLFLGNEEEAFDATIDALAEYMNTSQILDMDQMPLRLWDCIVGRVSQDSPTIESGTLSGFDEAVIKLGQAERLVFLLQSVFAVPVGRIMLITKWSEEKVTTLGASATARMKDCLRHPVKLEMSSFPQAQVPRGSIEIESCDTRGFFPPRRHTVN